MYTLTLCDKGTTLNQQINKIRVVILSPECMFWAIFVSNDEILLVRTKFAFRQKGVTYFFCCNAGAFSAGMQWKQEENKHFVHHQGFFVHYGGQNLFDAGGRKKTRKRNKS